MCVLGRSGIDTVFLLSVTMTIHITTTHRGAQSPFIYMLVHMHLGKENSRQLNKYELFLGEVACWFC